ncbi:MAG: hypothetical protein JEZ09_12970 [Salinivirgaceae bacterium]|nr:hypothetical protein [Salinivirgaceae bacterium]
MKNYIMLLFITVLFSRCDKLAEAYVGLPMQPKNINAEFEPGLNVFGVLTTGTLPTLNDSLRNYFEIQEIKQLSDTSQQFIPDVFIQLDLHRTNFDTTYIVKDTVDFTYYNSKIKTNPGDLYLFQCNYNGFFVTSQTLVPNIPEIVSNSLTRDASKITFEIKEDASAFLYDVYYTNENGATFQRQSSNINGNTLISINSSHNNISLAVFAYDKNYEQYVSTSNIFFKPNAYRPMYSTVEGGYGCVFSVCSEGYTIIGASLEHN